MKEALLIILSNRADMEKGGSAINNFQQNSHVALQNISSVALIALKCHPFQVLALGQ